MKDKVREAYKSPILKLWSLHLVGQPPGELGNNGNAKDSLKPAHGTRHSGMGPKNRTLPCDLIHTYSLRTTA